MQKFQAGLKNAYDQVAKIKGSAYSQVMVANQLILQTESIEQMLIGQFSSDFESNIQWARGVNA